MIKINNITKIIEESFFSKTLFSDISYVFNKSSTYVITGASGIGKSTLISIIAGFDLPTSGFVCWNNENIHMLSSEKKSYFRSSIIGCVFQKAYLIGEISVLENIMLPSLIAGKTTHEAETNAKIILHTLHLETKQYQAPGLLSGGELQRVALARAVANYPQFLFADEPTAFLDAETGSFITKWIFDYVATNKTGLIMNSHDQSLYHYAENLLVLQNQTLELLDIKKREGFINDFEAI